MEVSYERHLIELSKSTNEGPRIRRDIAEVTKDMELLSELAEDEDSVTRDIASKRLASKKSDK